MVGKIYCLIISMYYIYNVTHKYCLSYLTLLLLLFSKLLFSTFLCLFPNTALYIHRIPLYLNFLIFWNMNQFIFLLSIMLINMSFSLFHINSITSTKHKNITEKLKIIKIYYKKSLIVTKNNWIFNHQCKLKLEGEVSKIVIYSIITDNLNDKWSYNNKWVRNKILNKSQ